MRRAHEKARNGVGGVHASTSDLSAHTPPDLHNGYQGATHRGPANHHAAAAQLDPNPVLKRVEDAAAAAEGDPGDSTNAVNKALMEILLYFGRAVLFLFPVYMTGYLGLSITWVLFCLMLVTWWRKNTTRKRARLDTAFDFLENERLVINKEIKALNMPAWVHFPDVERADWLNKILQQAWPYFGIYMERLLKEKIQPSIRTSSHHLKTFTFTKVHFGQKVNAINGVKSYTDEVDKRQVILDLNLSYVGDLDIVAAVKKPITAGVQGVQLHGVLRVILEPLIGQSPLVGGITMFFIRRPTLDIDWTGVTNLLDSPAFNNLSESAILDIISSFMVLPNRLCIPLIDQVQIAQMRFPLPRGVVRVHLIEAQDLIASDSYMLGMVKGKSDPYTILRVGTQKFKSKTVKENLDPRWNEVFEFVVHEAPGQELEIEVFDEDTDKDDFLGSHQLDLGGVMKDRVIDEWYELDQGDSGKIHLKLEWLSLVQDQEKLVETQNGRACAMLAVYLDCASNLPKNTTEYTNDFAGKHGKPGKPVKVPKKNMDPNSFVELTVDRQMQKSKVAYLSKDPVWEQCFTFFVHSVKNQQLSVVVKDVDKKVPLGLMSLPFNRLLTATDMSMDQRFQLERSGANSSIKMTATLRVGCLDSVSLIPFTVEARHIIRAAGPVLCPDTITNACQIEQPPSPVLQTPSEQLPYPGPSDVMEEGGRRFVALRPDGQSESKQTAPTTPTRRDSTLYRRYDSSSMLSEYSMASSRYDLTEGGAPYPQFCCVSVCVCIISRAILNHQGGFGEIQLTVRYAALRKNLLVSVISCRNLVPCSETGTDAYVRIYLLPDRSWRNRKRTAVKKNTVDPLYDEKFEYSVSLEDAQRRMLDVAVKNNKMLRSRERKEIGTVMVDLSQEDLVKGFTYW
ncbi:EST2B protein, partial [Amia calva]|nr:EST2B protein [Amia calva]